MTEKLTFSKLKDWFKEEYPKNLKRKDLLITRLEACKKSQFMTDDISEVAANRTNHINPAERLLLCEGYICGDELSKKIIVAYLNILGATEFAHNLSDNTENTCIDMAKRVIEIYGHLTTDSTLLCELYFGSFLQSTDSQLLNYATDIIKFLFDERHLTLSLDTELAVLEAV